MKCMAVSFDHHYGAMFVKAGNKYREVYVADLIDL